MRVLIAGTGGVGGYFGARLASRGHDVWFLARGATLEALRASGLTVRSDHGDARLERVRAIGSGAEVGRPVDAVLVCVKTYDNASAAAAMVGTIGPGTVICSLQNGVENVDHFRARFPAATVLGGVTRIEAFVESPGVVVQRGAISDVVVGAFDPADRPAAARLVDALSGGPDPASLTDDVRSTLWFKLLIICGLGGATAFGRCSVGEVREDPDLRALMVGCFEEVEAVAQAQGIDLPEDPVGLILRSVEHLLPPESTSSMCRDVVRGRPLEVEALNGAAVRFGERVGVPTPANRRVLDELQPLHLEAIRRREASAQA